MQQETKVPLDLWDPQAPMVLWGNLDRKVPLGMMVLRAGTVLLAKEVIVETLGLQVCQAPRVPLALLALWVRQEMQDKGEIRVLEVL